MNESVTDNKLSVYDKLYSVAVSIWHEDNPNRNWQTNTIECKFDIDKKHLDPDTFYLSQFYLDEDLRGKVCQVFEHGEMFMACFVGGKHCSLNDTLYHYTIENYEKMCIEYRKTLHEARLQRKIWLKSVDAKIIK
jgi:hypothetical protein